MYSLFFITNFHMYSLTGTVFGFFLSVRNYIARLFSS